MGIEGGMLGSELEGVLEGFVCVLGGGRVLNLGTQGELWEWKKKSVGVGALSARRVWGKVECVGG